MRSSWASWARCDWGYVSASNDFRETWMWFTYATDLIRSWPGSSSFRALWNTHALYRRLALDPLALIRFKFRLEKAVLSRSCGASGASGACGQWVFCVPVIRAFLFLFVLFLVPCSVFLFPAVFSVFCGFRFVLSSLSFFAFHCALGCLLNSVCLSVCVWVCECVCPAAYA